MIALSFMWPEVLYIHVYIYIHIYTSICIYTYDLGIVDSPVAECRCVVHCGIEEKEVCPLYSKEEM